MDLGWVGPAGVVIDKSPEMGHNGRHPAAGAPRTAGMNPEI